MRKFGLNTEGLRFKIEIDHQHPLSFQCALGTNTLIQKMSQRSKFCHQYPNIVTNLDDFESCSL